MKRIIFILTTIVLSLFATKYAGEFTDLGVGVRPAGMGGAFAGFVGDIQSLWWNPAGLVGIGEKTKFYAMHAALYDNLYELNTGAFGKKLGESFWGAGFFVNATENIPFTHENGFYDYGLDRVPGTGDTGEGNGIWDPGEQRRTDAVFYNNEGDYLFTIGAAKPFGDKLLAGISIKHLQSYIGQYSAFGFGLDVGAIYQIEPKLALSATLRDATGTYIRWSSGRWEQKIPSLWWGAKHDIPIPSIRGGVASTCEIETRFENYDGIAEIGAVSFDPHIGIELTLLKHLFLRAGVDRKDITAGAGLGIAFFRVDYAFLSSGDLDNSHRIGIEFEIPEFPKIHFKRKPKAEALPHIEHMVEESEYFEIEPEIAIQSAPIGKLLAEIYFVSGDAELSKNARAVLDSVCRVWREFPTHRIYIEGHTDTIRISTPKYPNNLALSKDRANTTAEYLRENCGIPATRIVTDYFGQKKPKYDNATEKGRTKNRRVEVYLWEP